MSCVFSHRWPWVDRPTRRARVPALGAARLLAAFALVPVLAGGCASGPRGADRSQGWYDAKSVPAFVEDTTAPMPPVLEPEYVIGVGDELEVVFLYHTNLTTHDLIVRRDGRISLPYVGDQMAAGVTPMVLDSLLESRFSDILRDPSLSVIVNKAAPQRVYVLGKVKFPGKVDFEDELTMLQSVAGAGGFDTGALPSHAILIRRQGVSKIVGLEVDLQAVVSGAALQNDIRLRNYDIVYIPQSPISSAAEFAEQVGKIITVPMDIVFRGWQVVNLSASYEYFRSTHPAQTNSNGR